MRGEFKESSLVCGLTAAFGAFYLRGTSSTLALLTGGSALGAGVVILLGIGASGLDFLPWLLLLGLNVALATAMLMSRFIAVGWSLGEEEAFDKGFDAGFCEGLATCYFLDEHGDPQRSGHKLEGGRCAQCGINDISIAEAQAADEAYAIVDEAPAER